MSVHTTARNTASSNAASKTGVSNRTHLRDSMRRSPAQHSAERGPAKPVAARPGVSIKVGGDTPHRTARERLGLIDLDVLVGLHAPSPTAVVSPMVRRASVDRFLLEELPPLVPLVVSASASAPSHWTVSSETVSLETGPPESVPLESVPLESVAPRRLSAATTVATSRRRPSRSRTQLSGRGQVLVVFVVAFVIAGVAALTNLSRDAVESRSALTGATEVTVTVQPGDTLYSIAQRVAPQLDPQLVVTSITSTNDLSEDDVAHLQPGQLLAVPTS